MAGYYRKFIKDFAKRTVNMRRLMKDGVVFQWTQECQDEFDGIVDTLVAKPVMAFPDFNRAFMDMVQSYHRCILKVKE